MQLYFAPLACSMASRITLYEAGGDAEFVEVDTRSQRTADGRDYATLNPLGLVPLLRTDEGEWLTENAAILQYLADRYPSAALAPAAGLARSRLQQWLSFIGTELHKALFVPLFDRTQPQAVRDKVLAAGDKRLAHLDAHLAGRAHLLDAWSVADAYLVTVLNWHAATGVDLARWPAIRAWFEAQKARPSVARALAEETALYLAEQRRRAAAA